MVVTLAQDSYKYVQWNLLIKTLENKDTCIIWTLGSGPKVSLSMETDLENQDTLIIRTFLVGPKVS